MDRIKRKKGGFSLVEVIITLSVITIVCGAALTIAMSSLTAKKVAVNKIEGQNFAQNTLECFKASNNTTEFEELVSFSENIDLTPTAEGENILYTYTSDKYKFTATIEIGLPDGGRPTFSVEVKNAKEEAIISLDYTKGGAS